MGNKQAFNRRQFAFCLPTWSRGGVGVDMVNLFCCHPLTDGHFHGPARRSQIFRTCGQVVSICAGAIATSSASRVAPRARAMFQRLNHDKPGAFSPSQNHRGRGRKGGGRFRLLIGRAGSAWLRLNPARLTR